MLRKSSGKKTELSESLKSVSIEVQTTSVLETTKLQNFMLNTVIFSHFFTLKSIKSICE